MGLTLTLTMTTLNSLRDTSQAPDPLLLDLRRQDLARVALAHRAHPAPPLVLAAHPLDLLQLQASTKGERIVTARARNIIRTTEKLRLALKPWHRLSTTTTARKVTIVVPKRIIGAMIVVTLRLRLFKRTYSHVSTPI